MIWKQKKRMLNIVWNLVHFMQNGSTRGQAQKIRQLCNKQQKKQTITYNRLTMHAKFAQNDGRI